MYLFYEEYSTLTRTITIPGTVLRTVPTVEEHCMNMYEMCVCVCRNVVRHTHLISNVVTHKKVRAESHRRHKDLFRQVFSSVSSSIVL